MTPDNGRSGGDNELFTSLPPSPFIEEGAAPSVQHSLSRNATSRFVADVLALALGMASAVITARALGASGKGTFAALSYLLGLFVALASSGLGDSVIVLVGQKRASLRESTSSTISAVLLTGTLAGAAAYIVAHLQTRPETPDLSFAVAMTALLVPISALSGVLGTLVLARERFLLSSVMLVVISGITTATIFVCVVLADWGIRGAFIGVAAGNMAGLLGIAVPLHRMGLSLRPRWNAGYLKAAFRHGSVVQVSGLLMTLSGRVDLLIIYSLGGDAEAGQYSVALTIGQLVTYAAFAISLASYPRIAALTGSDAVPLLQQAARVSVVAGIAIAIPLATLTPFAIETLFGSEFRPAVRPAMVLIAGGVLFGLQWVLSRGATARGRPGVLLLSFATTLVVMIALDFILIPGHGVMGAAIASLVGPVLGIMVALLALRRAFSETFSLMAVVPRWADIRLTYSSGRSGVLALLRRFDGAG